MVLDPPLGTGVWNNPLHWDPNTGFPGASDTAILSGSQTLNLSGSINVLIFDHGNGQFGGSGTLSVLDEWKTSAGAELRGSTTIIAVQNASSANPVSSSLSKGEGGETLLTINFPFLDNTTDFAFHIENGDLINPWQTVLPDSLKITLGEGNVNTVAITIALAQIPESGSEFCRLVIETL